MVLEDVQRQCYGGNWKVVERWIHYCVCIMVKVNAKFSSSKIELVKGKTYFLKASLTQTHICHFNMRGFMRHTSVDWLSIGSLA